MHLLGKVPPSKARSFCRAPQSAKLLRLGVAETGVDHWSPAKNHEDTFLIVFFSLVRKERKGQKEEEIPLLNTFCRLAATGANKVPRPSNRNLSTATGSKRLSADSDSLLCHVELRQTSRVDFWCGTGCEHSEMWVISAICCSNTSSVAVNRATFSHWRRLARCRNFHDKNVHCVRNLIFIG